MFCFYALGQPEPLHHPSLALYRNASETILSERFLIKIHPQDLSQKRGLATQVYSLETSESSPCLPEFRTGDLRFLFKVDANSLVDGQHLCTNDVVKIDILIGNIGIIEIGVAGMGKPVFSDRQETNFI